MMSPTQSSFHNTFAVSLTNEEDAKAFIADIAAADIHWREWRYTSAIGEGSPLSKSPDKWIYD